LLPLFKGILIYLIKTCGTSIPFIFAVAEPMQIIKNVAANCVAASSELTSAAIRFTNQSSPAIQGGLQQLQLAANQVAAFGRKNWLPLSIGATTTVIIAIITATVQAWSGISPSIPSLGSLALDETVKSVQESAGSIS